MRHICERCNAVLPVQAMRYQNLRGLAGSYEGYAWYCRDIFMCRKRRQELADSRKATAR